MHVNSVDLAVDREEPSRRAADTRQRLSKTFHTAIRLCPGACCSLMASALFLSSGIDSVPSEDLESKKRTTIR